MNKTKELKSYIYFGLSDIGNYRLENEDAYAHIESVNGDFFVLCDGMGGIKGGKEAAEITINQIEEYVNEEWEENPKKLILNAIEFANNKVFQTFKKRKIIQNPGTTIVLLLIRDNKIYYAHVGDSRIYYQTGKRLFLLTQDHSYVMNLVKKKIITEEEAVNHLRRNEITKAIGIKDNVEPEICKESIIPADGDNILLCSDGLTNELTNKEILKILLNNKDTKKKTSQMISSAIESGGNDNITVQLVKFYNTGRESNKEFLNSRKESKRKYKLILFSLFFMLVIALVLIVFFYNPKAKIFNRIKNDSGTFFLMHEKQNKDTVINLFLPNIIEHKSIIKKYNVTKDEFGHSSAFVGENGFIKYYIPVKAIYNYRVGKLIYSYPEINHENIIDVIIVNNKENLFFIPGEKIIIPKSTK